MAKQEAVKLLPLGDVWNYYCEESGIVDDFGLFDEVEKYEKDVLVKRA